MALTGTRNVKEAGPHKLWSAALAPSVRGL